ncbi:LGFP repeat-containing protein [Nocardia fluminea]|uniref:LGFP repeat-containing protein n=1 Tax=Nocardia fluminea TaxID=134984 RepID=UPI0036643B49
MSPPAEYGPRTSTTPKAKPGKWRKSDNPKSSIVPGQMRSDREEIPEGFSKEDADRAETMEAQLAANGGQRPAADSAPTFIAGEGCSVYWPSPHYVCGAIRDKYDSLGGPNSFLLWPTSGELTNPDSVGRRSEFQNGPIYWSPWGGAHPVVNSFLNRWAIHGYEGGWMRYPTTDEIVLADGGRRQEFETGVIYVAFQNAVGSAIRNGPLRDKYNSVGGSAPGGTFLGYPIQDQIGLPPDNQGQMVRFQNGVIYWSPTTEARIVHGEILARWADAGYEQGTFGYPVGEQTTGPDNRYTQEFQRGSIEVYTLFTHQFEYEDAAGIIQFCVFAGRADRVHISTWGQNPTGKTASGHAWWVAIKNCKPMTTATVTAQLQYKNSSGDWVDRGAEATASKIYPGGGSGQRAAANDPCNGTASTTWRVKIDVDVDGSPDASNKEYGDENTFGCG